MGADKSAENTPNAQKMLGPICLPKPSLGFSKKSSLWVSVVRALSERIYFNFVCIFFLSLFFEKNIDIMFNINDPNK